MKKVSVFIMLLVLAGILLGCTDTAPAPQVAATTLPVYEFTAWLCQGTDIQVVRLVSESVSCLHDYTLQVSQMRAVESADAVILSGAGLEEFLDDILDSSAAAIDSSVGIPLFSGEETHVHGHDHEHDHEHDPHIWLSPANAKLMAQSICTGLSEYFPESADTFAANLITLNAKFDALEAYGKEALSQLACRELITFHDGFAYFADAFDLTILHAMEEESGSEAAASEIIEIVRMVDAHRLPAIFTETNGSTAAASIIAAETGANVFSLDMAMAGDSYFDAMYRNIDTIKEALG